jgi:hypothetical protein
MKRFLLSVFTLLFTLAIQAQELDKAKAMELVIKNKTALGLSDNDVVNCLVSDAYISHSSGLTMVYLQQSYKGLPVYNQLLSLAFKDEKLFSNFGKWIHDINKKVNTLNIFPSVIPEVSVKKALKEKKIFNFNSLIATTLIPGRKFDFGKAGVAHENITAELLWVPVENGNRVILAWQIYLVPTSSSDYWMIRIDANTNEVIEENNLTVFCDWNKNSGNEKSIAGNFVQTKKMNKIKESNSSISSFLGNIQSEEKKTFSPSIINNVTYRVVPIPYESPNHGPNTSEVVTNPWTLTPGNATTLKWHSTGTIDYTTTRGNNVWAQEDVNGNNGTGISATSTSSADPLSFNFVPDFNVSPTTSTTTKNQQFNITNLFYWNNLMHDITYQYGFDEPAGNFQSNNQGRGGSGNDYVLADAQDGSGTNNANFSTPADGGSGRMQMYLWNAVPGFTVNAPASIAGTYQAVESSFSTGNKLVNVGPVTGQVIYYNDNAAGTTHEACTGAPTNSINGKIALIDRSTCNFTVKVKNAQTAGAIAVIMINNVAGNPIIMGGTDNTITIPAVMISMADGLILKNELANNENVTLSGGQAIDGDVDNGVISHEYSHGISTRLTGGPANSSCLGNAEQMGEGWSDYFALMVTQDWANSTTTTGFTSPRGIGTYVFGQLPNQDGIRTQKYCTDFSINNKVYATSIPSEIHELGELWCATLWDMTWNIIQATNAVNPNIFNSNSTGGNSIALKLVIEGLKLQPCSPGFIDGRNAILKADSILFGGAYNCEIREAFRRRGMGLYASQGSSSSVTDQVADFTPYVTIKKSQNINDASAGQNVTYTTVVNSCSAITNYTLRDTLPSNVTYVSGGTYDAANRVVSFPVNFTAGQTQSFSFTANVNAGSYFAPQTLLEEHVTGTTMPSTFTASSTTTNVWSVSSTQSLSSPNSLFTPDAGSISDQKLETTTALALGAGTSSLSFSHLYNTQTGYDGGVVEISTDNGTTWVDLSNKITSGYFNSTLASGSGNSLAGRKAWSGNSNGFINSSINLSSYSGQNAKLRFRFGSNTTTSGTGWYIDDIIVKRKPVVNIRASLFNTNGVRVYYSDTVTNILETTVCTSVLVNAQPVNQTICVGSNATFSVNADGTSPIYQWQVSTDGGTTYTNITGATNSSLTLNSITASMNNNRYRVVVTNSCPSTSTSDAAVLIVNIPASINTQPVAQTACVGANVSFAVNSSGSANTYQWQVSTDGGVTFSNIPGATNQTCILNSVTSIQNGNLYRVVISSCSPSVLNSNAVQLTISNQASITSQPSNTPACTGSSATFIVSALGSSIAYQWQVSTDGGVTYSDISGAISANLVLNGVTSTMNNNKYRALISNSCSSSIFSDAGILTVSDPAVLIAQPNNNTICEGSDVSFSVAATGTNITYQWQISTDGGITFNNISGATAAILSITNITASMNNNRYRAIIFSCSATGLNSNAAILSVNNLATISTQPANFDACPGNNAIFSATSNGTNVSYQWQISTDDGATYSDITGANSSTLNLPNVTLAMNNYRYRTLISNSCPSSDISSFALLTVSGSAVISSQPANETICEGQSVTFNATASGSTYQWEMSTDGGSTYTNISGANASSLTIPAVTLSMNGNRYRLVLGGCSSTSLNSDAATLSVNAQASIVAQPNNFTACVGNNANFTTTVNGAGLNYQWQISTDGGITFTNIFGAVNAALTLNNVTLNMNNNLYRVSITGDCTPSLVSNSATLSVNNQASIVTQPSSSSACPGSNVSFSITAIGPGLTYQWQVSTDGGISFVNINGENTTTLNLVNITSQLNNNRYRVVVNSSCSAIGNNSESGLLTVLPEALVNVAPENFSGCAGSTANFITSISANNLSYQWQVSTDGGSNYINISGATDSFLVLNNITTAMNNNKYRVVAVADPCGVTTNAALLSVLPSPAVTLSATPYHSLLPNLHTTLTATSIPTGTTYNWYKNGVLVTGVNGNTLTVNYADKGTYTVKDMNGCDNISNSINILDSLSNTLFVYPNPNNGQFTVQYFNGNNSQKRTVTLFDSKGARVYVQEYNMNSGFDVMEVVVKKLSAGTYMLLLTDGNGVKIATTKIVKQ